MGTVFRQLPRKVLILWAVWAIFLLAYQAILLRAFPDLYNDELVQDHDEIVYLTTPFLNEHVAWDSEYYLSIAVAGYDDPLMRTVETPEGAYTYSHAFMPFYPLLIRIFSTPFFLMKLNPVAVATLAGIMISLLGVLVGGLSLYELLGEVYDEADSFRGVLYLFFFPSSFFFAQVYTEGLFIGLFFGSLLLIKHKRFIPATLVIACATVTRAVGGVLLLPLILGIIEPINWKENPLKGITKKMNVHLALASLPLIAYIIWRMVLGEGFDVVQDTIYDRGLFKFRATFIDLVTRDFTLYHGIEIITIILATLSIVLTVKTQPMIALVSIMVMLVAVPSGVFQSMTRYLLPLPAIYFFLVEAGKRKWVNLLWLSYSVLCFLLFSMLFTFDYFAI